MKYEPVIGLEIHIQLKTKSKMFCACDNTGEDKEPNTTICPICTGQPGTLPVINNQAIDWAILIGMVLNGKIAKFSKFDRKNYFYPDLPKGYQISQYDLPIVSGGYLEINNRKIKLERIHLEEDAAKLIHKKNSTLIDFNRAGTPLLEIVTKPEIKTPQEAKLFLQELRLIMRYQGVSCADMEKGHLRCDANISLRPIGGKKLYPKIEIKNLNSFKAVERALEYEIKRQAKLWEENKAPKEQETRGWDDAKGVTIEQRTKEEASDYRYFPEPDLPPLKIGEERINKIKRMKRETPQAKRKRFAEEYEFNSEESKALTDDRDLSYYAEQVISELRTWLLTLGLEGTEEEIWKENKRKLVKLVANWIINRLNKIVDESDSLIKEIKITPARFAKFISLIYQNKITSNLAQRILEKMFKTGSDPEHIIEEDDLTQMSDEKSLQETLKKIIKSNPKVVEDYKKGKANALQFLVGQAMKETKGKMDARQIVNLLKEIL
ncbi:MAG: aspartyl-tRNA(Asn)/glutamyl-tRNA (Gln) amidotransferase subunit B [Parcubacteria group bacterium Athens1014_10]|nr:MAG: aspartyl-tRNA(Asn)/glutamyl-tRNA (Gln) amidotransferase subunit B [Parcubacteria group bacterium Athens1014_10]TSD06102.1 MAG: aspartyl-tRNA(Asn)/glutamyl-tRNA (Gln) amidotransferase subunit B [Parcubacteria group bacterium Athens0714_12]